MTVQAELPGVGVKKPLFSNKLLYQPFGYLHCNYDLQLQDRCARLAALGFHSTDRKVG